MVNHSPRFAFLLLVFLPLPLLFGCGGPVSQAQPAAPLPAVVPAGGGGYSAGGSASSSGLSSGGGEGFHFTNPSTGEREYHESLVPAPNLPNPPEVPRHLLEPVKAGAEPEAAVAIPN